MDQIFPHFSADLATAVAALREAPIEQLRDPEWLEFDFLPDLGLNNEAIHEFPTALYPWCGRGLKSWQYPNQFSRYLCHLSGLGIETYAEIGCRHGGTFIITVEYLKRFGPLRKAAAIDLMASPILYEYAKTQPFDYIIASSRSAAVLQYLGQPGWDLVLVDGDHSLEGCVADYSAVRNSAKRVALHDIASDACPGVPAFWDVLKGVMPAHKLFEQVQQYDEVRTRTGRRYLGLGIVDLS